MDKLAQQYISRHPADAARSIARFTDAEKTQLFGDIEAGTTAALLGHMPGADAGYSLTLIPAADVIPVLMAMPSNLAAACLRRMPGNIRNGILELARDEPGLRRVLGLLRFSVHDAGAIMDPDVLVPVSDQTVGEVIELVKRHPDTLEEKLYVVDRSRQLAGVVISRELLLADHLSGLHTLLHPCRYTIPAHAHLHSARDNPGWVDTDTLPVVDNHNLLLGVLSLVELDRRLGELGSNNPFNDQPGDILIGLAETFVNTCSEILFPGQKP